MKIPCPYCDKLYVSKSNRNYHLKIKHDITIKSAKGRPLKKISIKQEEIPQQQTYFDQKNQFVIKTLRVGLLIYKSQHGLIDMDKNFHQQDMMNSSIKSLKILINWQDQRERVLQRLRQLLLFTNRPEFLQFFSKIMLNLLRNIQRKQFKNFLDKSVHSYDERVEAEVQQLQGLFKNYFRLSFSL